MEVNGHFTPRHPSQGKESLVLIGWEGDQEKMKMI